MFSRDYIATVSDCVAEVTGLSNRLRSYSFGLWVMLPEILHSYKIQLFQELKHKEYRLRRIQADFVGVDSDFSKKFCSFDEAYFIHSGYADQQICRIRGRKIPHMINDKPMDAQKVTMGFVLWSISLTGPNFLPKIQVIYDQPTVSFIGKLQPNIFGMKSKKLIQC